MRNSTGSMIHNDELKANCVFDKRPEQMGVAEFEMIARLITEQAEP